MRLISGIVVPFSFIFNVLGNELYTSFAFIVRKGGEHVVYVKGFVVERSAIRQTAPLALAQDNDVNEDKDEDVDKK